MRLEANERDRLQLAQAMMNATLDRIGELGVQIKMHHWYIRKNKLSYAASDLGAVGEPNRSRTWPSEWNKFKLVVDRT